VGEKKIKKKLIIEWKHKSTKHPQNPKNKNKNKNSG
jgi:hypothetical protein